MATYTYAHKCSMFVRTFTFMLCTQVYYSFVIVLEIQLCILQSLQTKAFNVIKGGSLFCCFSDHLAKKLIAFQAFSYLLFHLTFSKFYFEKVQSLGKMGRKVTFEKICLRKKNMLRSRAKSSK